MAYDLQSLTVNFLSFSAGTLLWPPGMAIWIRITVDIEAVEKEQGKLLAQS